MALSKRYNSAEVEARLQAMWQVEGVYHFSTDDDRPIYSIDTPPATVSGHLHLGHVYSYSHADFMAHFWRMNGYNVYYPMGFDDNGVPTKRLVEKWLDICATEVGRRAFIEKCLEVSERAEKDYRGLFASSDGARWIHLSRWPRVNESFLDDQAEAAGETLVDIATTVHRYKSKRGTSIGCRAGPFATGDR